MNPVSESIQGRVLVQGRALAPVLFLDDALSFWGGFDPQAGKIIDVHHPQAGQLVAGKILVIPSSRGSAGTPACIAETLRNGSGPLAFVLASADVNICVGVSVANRLYQMNIPVVEIDPTLLSKFKNVEQVKINDHGLIEIEPINENE